MVWAQRLASRELHQGWEAGSCIHAASASSSSLSLHPCLLAAVQKVQQHGCSFLLSGLGRALHWLEAASVPQLGSEELGEAVVAQVQFLAVWPWCRCRGRPLLLTCHKSHLARMGQDPDCFSPQLEMVATYWAI